jgi:hypothetical protein
MQVNLSWAGVTNALFYRVYRGTLSGGPYLLIGQSNPNPGMTSASTNIITTYQDGPNNLVNGVNYYYTISAVTADGESPYSAEVAAIWPGAPASPINPVATIT